MIYRVETNFLATAGACVKGVFLKLKLYAYFSTSKVGQFLSDEYDVSYFRLKNVINGIFRISRISLISKL